MVDTDSSLQEGEDFLDLWEVSVVVGKRVQSIGVYTFYKIFFILYSLAFITEGKDCR